ncbi:MAG TPA: hypothetical protein VGP72_04235 [Planctomycetota bacterium]|jgi:hypothetical protein
MKNGIFKAVFSFPRQKPKTVLVIPNRIFETWRLSPRLHWIHPMFAASPSSETSLVAAHYFSSSIRRVLKPGGLCVYTVRHTGDPHYRIGAHRGEDMYEINEFIVHFFTREKVTQLARGYEIVTIDEFEEERLPKRLFRVTLRKAHAQ